ncbi:hypothetical protein [Streptomyces sp. NPDC004976]
MSTGAVGLGGSPDAVVAGERGATTIADRVVAKIASQGREQGRTITNAQTR